MSATASPSLRRLGSSSLPLSALAAVALLGALGAGCSNASEPAAEEVTVARSSLARDVAPVLADAERTAFASERADFAVDFFRKVTETEQGNVLVSPHSASTALAMTYAGTGAPTKEPMAKALRFSLADARLHAAFNATDLALSTRPHEAKSPEDGAVALASANSLWAQSRDAWESAYLDTLAVNYGSGINLLDFTRDDGEPARVAINGWVSERTRSKIPELLRQGQLRDALWVLVNALYMKASWQHRFERQSTTDGAFVTASGQTVTGPTMRQWSTLRALHRADLDAVEMPYDGGDLVMLAIAPAAGTFASYASSVTGKDLLGLPLENQYVDLSMPKFEVRSGGDRTKALEALGMPKTGAFPGGAEEIAVIQKTFLAADEDGTEAAAATAVIGLPSSAGVDPPKPLRIALDRPFLYAIVDKPTGAVLFLGRVLDPTAK